MADLTTLTALVRNKCPGPVDFLTEDALAKVYREFCLRSEYLNKTEAVASVDEGGQAVITPPAGHYLLKVITVKTESGSELVPAGQDYTQPEPGQLVFKRGHTNLAVTYSYCPTPLFDRSNCDDDVINRWADELAAGAAAELRIMPGKDWTEPALADYYRRDFVRGWRDAKRAREEQFDDFQNYTRKHTFY